MVYNTGSRDDWDYISRITDDPTWSWDAMAHHRDLNQRYVAPNDGHDDVSRNRVFSLLPHSYHPLQTDQYLPSAHNRNGMVSISLPGYPKSIDSKITAAITEPGFASAFPFQRDMNTGNTVCFTTATLPGPCSLICLRFWNRSALAGYRALSAMASALVRPPATLDRITLTALIYTFCFTPMLPNFSRQPISVPRLLTSMGLSLGPDPVVSR